MLTPEQHAALCGPTTRDARFGSDSQLWASLKAAGASDSEAEELVLTRCGPTGYGRIAELLDPPTESD